MNPWYNEAVFYHIYPLGFCGAPKSNDFKAGPVERLAKIYDWIDHIKYLGANSIYFGPIFESTSHGYDTTDYNVVDRRLGNKDTFIKLVKTLHENNIRVVIDGVFNHVGRDFFAFKDILLNGQKSRYCSWFHNLNFNQKSPLNDPFSYDTWNGYYNLVKLNLGNQEVKEYLFEAIKMWIKELDIDGLRLDCADCLDFNFITEMSSLCKKIKPDFWLMGEIIHGDYNRWANTNMLDSVTNYECYKGLYSSHNDKNYFEIAYSFNRQFGENFGIYRNIYLYNFVDNHDVNRIASTLKYLDYIYPLHVLLFTMPGIPSIYYGSEWGIKGTKNISDDDLRPELDLTSMSSSNSNKNLIELIHQLAEIRKNSKALMHGKYFQIKVMNEQFSYARIMEEDCIIIVVNLSQKSTSLEIDIPIKGVRVVDILNNKETFKIENNKCLVSDLQPCWARILKVE
ncbi:MAG: alpha-amylase family glycosyl hydrolase [Clostridium sp.]|uniref:alpha-amylase family glycosyl hydrolase n=1 Tax=Clostridium sp. TaxID=1506 RepID=UPI0039EA9B07